MDGVQGLCVVGRYGGEGPKVYGPSHSKAGQVVPGMREVRVVTERRNGDEYVHRLSFFVDDFDGEPTRFGRYLSQFEAEEGDPVAVVVRAKASGKYVNLEPVSIHRLGDDEQAAPISLAG